MSNHSEPAGLAVTEKLIAAAVWFGAGDPDRAVAKARKWIVVGKD